MNYWLMKSEPSTYSIDRLKSISNQTDQWEGVRNYQARNFMRDDMRLQDQAFLYHSNCKIPGIAGVVEIVKESHPDLTALDPHSSYYDPKATKDNPRWFMVSVRLIENWSPLLPLTLLKTIPELENMVLLRKGNRLSVMPVTAKEWRIILSTYQSIKDLKP